jgi:septal ring factor EnvC (AmiA/AmiB activator)
MEDITLTQLFARMDDHLAQQDAYLREAQATNHKIDEHLARQDTYLGALMEGLRETNVQLARVGETLAATAREVAVIHTEASRQHAETRLAFEALLARLAPPREETPR